MTGPNFYIVVTEMSTLTTMPFIYKIRIYLALIHSHKQFTIYVTYLICLNSYKTFVVSYLTSINKIFLKSLSKYIFIGAVGLFYTYRNCINVCWINVDWITNPWFLALIGRMMKRLPFSVLSLGDISQGKCRS